VETDEPRPTGVCGDTAEETGDEPLAMVCIKGKLTIGSCACGTPAGRVAIPKLWLVKPIAERAEGVLGGEEDLTEHPSLAGSG
jgi:hypothetical protein